MDFKNESREQSSTLYRMHTGRFKALCWFYFQSFHNGECATVMLKNYISKTGSRNNQVNFIHSNSNKLCLCGKYQIVFDLVHMRMQYFRPFVCLNILLCWLYFINIKMNRIFFITWYDFSSWRFISVLVWNAGGLYRTRILNNMLHYFQ